MTQEPEEFEITEIEVASPSSPTKPMKPTNVSLDTGTCIAQPTTKVSRMGTEPNPDPKVILEEIEIEIEEEIE